MGEHIAEKGLPPGPETCPSLCVERSHPGSEHDPAEHGCYCWELCSMGPTCPGANAGLDRGCWRTRALPERQSPIPDVRKSGGMVTRVTSPVDGREVTP